MTKQILFVFAMLFSFAPSAFSQNSDICFEGKTYETKGYINEGHLDYAGEIVFSNKRIPEDDLSNLITNYTLGDDLNMRYFLFEDGMANGFFEMLNEEDNIQDLSQLTSEEAALVNKENCLDADELLEGMGFKVNFWVDGEVVGMKEIPSDNFDLDEKAEKTTFQSSADDPLRNLGYWLTEIFKERQMSKGTYEVIVQLQPYMTEPFEFTGWSMAKGTFNVTVENDLVEEVEDNCPLPKDIWEGEDGEVLKARVLKAFLKKGWEETPQQVILTRDRWYISRDKETKQILDRYISATIVSTRGGECIYQDFNFKEDYDGRDYQSTLYLEGVGIQRKVDCDCLK